MKVTEKWRCSAKKKSLARTTIESNRRKQQSAQAEQERGENGGYAAGQKDIPRDSAAARVREQSIKGV